MRLQENIQDQSEKIMMLSSENSILDTRVHDLTEEKETLEMENELIKRAKETTIKGWTALQAKHQQVGAIMLYASICVCTASI